MERIKLEISLDEANLILAALGQQPYVKVASLIQSIREQGAAQMQPPTPEEMLNTSHNDTAALIQEQNEK